jgi:amidohydrolase
MDRDMKMAVSVVCFCVVVAWGAAGGSASGALGQEPGEATCAALIDRLAAEVQPQAIAWRRDIHQHPELSNREVRTAALVADHLRRLGLEVRTGVAHTGVVGVLRGGRPGPVVALRADMDALPVTEAVDLPFASKVRTEYDGREVGVMHACGHDVHTAVLMAVAQVLARMRQDLPGTVKFLFQPAEEGAPKGEEGGAQLMIREGALEDPRPEAIFALHVNPDYPAGTIAYRPGAIMANQDSLRIVVRGRQTHGALPWGGTDPIVVASQIVLGLQTIVSRQIDLPLAPAVITIGVFRGGVRSNIIPDEVEMIGTIRTFDPAMRTDIHARIRRTAAGIAQSGGAAAEVTIDPGYPVTCNDPNLIARMAPVLAATAGQGHAILIPPCTGAEDFSYFEQQVPGLYFFLGVTPADRDCRKAPKLHSPQFYVDESAILLGIRTLARLTLARLEQ